MTNEEYDKLISKYTPKESVFKNMIVSFFSGGFIGLFSEILYSLFIRYVVSNQADAYLLVFACLVITGSLLTGLGFFDHILSICRCGFIVPSTGFANSMTSASMDYKNEGFIKGIGSGMFKLTGSIIIYGVIFGIIFGYIRSII